MKVDPDKTPPLSPATLHILLALAGGDLHGYGIIQEIARHSEGHYKPGPGTLYDNLKKLMDAGLVADVLKSASLSCVSQNRAGRVTPLVIGTGAYGRLPVMKEVKLEAERRHVDWSSYRPVRPSGS